MRSLQQERWLAALGVMAAGGILGGGWMILEAMLAGRAGLLALGGVLVAFGCYVGFVSLPAELRTPSPPIGKSPGGPTSAERTAGLVGLWCLALFFALIGFPWGATIIHRALGPEGPVVLIELLFLPVPALLLLAYAIVLTRRHRRARVSRLDMPHA